MSIITSFIAMAVGFYLLLRSLNVVISAIRTGRTNHKGFKLALFLIGISGMYIGLQLAWVTYKDAMPDFFNFFWDLLDIFLLLYVMSSAEDEIRKLERESKNARKTNNRNN